MPRPLVIGALVLVLAGCTPATPPKPPPAPVPTFMCTPEAGGAEFRCDQKAHDEMVAKDALYQEAQQTYMRWFVQRQRLFRDGVPADEAALAFAEGQARTALTQAHASAPKLAGEVALPWMRRLTGLVKDGSVTALEVCWDGSKAQFATGPAQGQSAGSWSERAFFGGSPGALKVVAVDTKQVASCV